MTGSVLLVTLPPTRGGVPTKTRILARFLRRRGYDVGIAHYATMSEFGDLSVPSWNLIHGKRPTVQQGTCFGDFPSSAVGCAFPELEFTYYRSSKHWRRALEGYDRYIAVGGTVLVSNPLVALDIPHMTWCASTMIDDRIDRRGAMPAPRRIFDAAVIGPVQRSMEKRILSRETRFMTVSDYARRTLIAAGGDADRFMTVPVPVDRTAFSPPLVVSTGKIGFAGRADDPRKNIDLLLQAFRIVADRDPAAELLLTGNASPDVERWVEKLGIADRVHWTGWLTPAALSDFYRSLDVFVFPSHKEGLGIAGIEAMSSGVPVVSTRCGGPEDFVLDGETGRLVNEDPAEMADAIASIYTRRQVRDEMSRNAVALITERYSMETFEENISVNWQLTWGDSP
ncbi:MAG: glycosyltransferase family 4 protein [Rhodospirillales bacterium]